MLGTVLVFDVPLFVVNPRLFKVRNFHPQIQIVLYYNRLPLKGPHRHVTKHPFCGHRTVLFTRLQSPSSLSLNKSSFSEPGWVD